MPDIILKKASYEFNAVNGHSFYTVSTKHFGQSVKRVFSILQQINCAPPPI